MTGYVHHMVEKNQTFPQFAMSCARAFGALIEMRDEGMDAKIPDEIKPEPYHKKAAAEARKELAAFEDDEGWAFGVGRSHQAAGGGRLSAMHQRRQSVTRPTRRDGGAD
jgi:hypothetical protein